MLHALRLLRMEVNMRVLHPTPFSTVPDRSYLWHLRFGSSMVDRDTPGNAPGMDQGSSLAGFCRMVGTENRLVLRAASLAPSPDGQWQTHLTKRDTRLAHPMPTIIIH
jgi:hypothetical protein